MKLLVRNLAKATTEEKLLALFKEYGDIQSCNLVLDKETGASKGFAFVEMPKPGEAKAAIKQLNGYKLAGNVIRVKKSESKKSTEDTSAVKDPAIKTLEIKAPAEEKIPKKAKATTKSVKPVTEKTEPVTEMVDAAEVWGNVKEY